MPLDEDGFLDSQVRVRATLSEASPGELLSLHAAAEAPALVLLGEPGLGKTTALRSISGELKANGVRVVWIDGADLVEESLVEELGRHADQRPSTDAQTASGPERLTLVIDALDESGVVRRFPRRLREALGGRNLASFQLILGCRTADVPGDLADVLEQLFGDGTVFADLSPLRRSDAIALASSRGAPGEHLTSAAVMLGAGALAAIPLTLGLLVDEQLEKGALNASARQLFERGVVALLDATHLSAAGDDTSTVNQRRAVAERIAAVMLLSGKRTVFVGRALDAGRQDLRASDISDGIERTAGGAFHVTPSLVRATLGTALFGGRGPDRLAFVHASQAAFLAACYLSRRDPRVPRRQLEDLLLVAAPDGSRTVPVPLRELAAWLASLDAVTGAWLAETDPGSMVGHESYLESDNLRSTVVRALLLRAGEFELGERYWTKGIDLSHPGLPAQVLSVLNEFDAQPAEWTDFARCRVALRLAKYARSSELTERLLQIAESTDWNAHLGSLAVEAVSAQGASAIPRVSLLLRALDDPDFALQRDPDDELKGHLLDLLWPRHAAVTDVLPSLTRRQSRLVGTYLAFLRSFPEQLDEKQLTTALEWAAGAASIESVAAHPNTAAALVLPDTRPVSTLEVVLAEALVERALQFGHLGLMQYAAALTWPRLDRYDHPTLPSSLDEAIVGGSTAEARRSFAEALLRYKTVSTRRQVDIWHMVRAWQPHLLPLSESDSSPRSSLLDSADFVWAVERAEQLAATEAPLAEALAELAGLLFDPSDIETLDIASRHRDTIVWKHIAHRFDPVDLDSEEAERLRERHGRAKNDERVRVSETQEARALRADLLEQYTGLIAGDWTRFWRVAWLLHFDPEAARERAHFRDRILSFPAMSVLPPDAPAKLAASARDFLINETDHATEWLGTDIYDRRAWAGYLALALLDETDQLGSVPTDQLASWTGAILWFPILSEMADPEQKKRLVSLSIEADADRMAELLTRYVRGALRQGASASGVEAFDPASVLAIERTWIDMIMELYNALVAPGIAVGPQADAREPLGGFASDKERTTARYAWQSMLRGLAVADPLEAEALAIRWATAGDDAHEMDLAATAVVVSLSAEPAAWRRLVSIVQSNDDLGRAVAVAIANDHRDVDLLAALDERELADMYVWMATIYPPEEDLPEPLGASWGTPVGQVRYWRDNLLTTVANRGTEDAVLVLSDLHKRFPSRIIVLSNLIRARLTAFANAWEPPSPAEVQALLEDDRRRLVRSGEELALLIQEALEAVEADLIRTGQLLWDRLESAGGGVRQWAPKPEAALSAFLAHDLQLRLHDRGAAVHREVLVKPTDPNGAGDQPDILVEATTRAEDNLRPTVHRVAIEVKGPWNRDLLRAQREQLALRYMPETETTVGLYIVGWYPKELWDATDYRRAQVPKPTKEDLLETLTLQAHEIRGDSELSVIPIVLTVPRPAPNEPADKG